MALQLEMPVVLCLTPFLRKCSRLHSQNSKKQWHSFSFTDTLNSFGQNINIYWYITGICKHYLCPLIGQHINCYHFLYFYIQAFQKPCIKASVELCLEQQYAFYSAVIVFILLYISLLLSRLKRLEGKYLILTICTKNQSENVINAFTVITEVIWGT